MPSRNTSSGTRLYAIAEGQQGFFTARQAISAGFDRRNHSYHVSRGNWVREWRGIYRLSRFPRTPEADLALYSLWSMGESKVPLGVLSHETALSTHDLSHVLSARIHMTVPEDFGNRETPPVLVLHRAKLLPAEMEQRPGYRVTSVLRTFLDLTSAGTVSKDVLAHGIFQAVDRGKLPIAEVERHPTLQEHLPDVQKYEAADPIYKFLKTLIKPPAEPVLGYEQDMRKAAATLQSGLESLIKWLTRQRPEVARGKRLKRGLGSASEQTPSP
jgi:hypothetical protein